MKGWRTVAFGLFVAAAPPALQFLAGVNWTELGLSPQMGAAIGFVIIGLRAITTTAIGSK